MLTCEHSKGVACGPCAVKWFQENRLFLVQVQQLVDYYESLLHPPKEEKEQQTEEEKEQQTEEEKLE